MRKQNPDLAQVETFVAVARLGSFTAAADDLDISRTMASKNVQLLEDRLRVKLLNRTTRSVHLTEAGAAYLEQAQEALRVLEQAGEQAASLAGQATGRLRVAAPLIFATLYLSPVIGAFQDRYPDIQMEVDLSDALSDLIEGGFDVALRIGTMADSGLIQRRLVPIRRVICAAPSYLDRHGRPGGPEDLARFNCLDYRHMAERTQWVLMQGETRHSVYVTGDLRANNGEFLTRVAIAGRGIVNIPTFIAAGALRDGRLERVLPGFAPPEQALFALYPAGRAVPMKLRVFLDFIARALAELPAWDAGGHAAEPSGA